MSLGEMLALFRRAGQPVTPLLDGAPCDDLDIGRLLAAGQKRLVQLRPELLNGKHLAVVQASHAPDVDIRSTVVAPATIVIHSATVTHVWLLTAPVDGSVAAALCRLVEARLGGAAWRSVPTAPLRVPGTPDLRWSEPLSVTAAGSVQLVAADALLTDPHGRDVARALLDGRAVAA